MSVAVASPRKTRRLALAILIALFLAAVLASAVFAQEPGTVKGTWSIELPAKRGRVALTMKRRGGGGHSWSSTDMVPVADLKGFAPPASGNPVDVRFQIVRDAGSFTFEGQSDNEVAWGKFLFAGNEAYARELEAQGHGSISSDDLLSFAVHDVSRAFVRGLADLGYAKLSTDDLLSMAIHGATPAYVRAMRGLGFERLSPDDLVSMRIHGVSEEFVGEMRALGYEDLTADDLVSMRIHGVSAEFVRELEQLGYRRVSADDLVSMRIHGVTPDYIRQMREIGISKMTVDDLVSMKIHGVSAEDARRVLRADPSATADDLVSWKIHGGVRS
ncbi:MAG TPA: hypothetical protein VIA29_04275 [Thermoanaerobaculia bacterium]